MLPLRSSCRLPTLLRAFGSSAKASSRSLTIQHGARISNKANEHRVQLFGSRRGMGPALLRGARPYSNYGSASDAFGVMNAYWVLFGLNCVPFGLYWYSRITDNRNLQVEVMKNTLVSAESVERGRWWTVLTSAFSHQAPLHFLFNMMTAKTFCSILSWVPGLTGVHILSAALGAGIAGSAGFVYSQRQKSMNQGAMGRFQAHHGSALGASGAVMGLGVLASCLNPYTKVTLMFIPVGLPLWGVTLAYLGADLYFLDSPTSPVAHAGHLGGFAFGAAYYLAYLQKFGGVSSILRRLTRR